MTVSRLIKQIAVFAALIFIATGISGFRPAMQGRTPGTVLLGPKVTLQMPLLTRLREKLKASVNPEKDKIRYLISRVRTSKNTFVRNGETHSAIQAAMLLEWKLQKRIEKVKTAEDFIREVASSSAKTGEPYLMKDGDGTLYPVQDVLHNEMRLLETLIQEATPFGTSATTSDF